MGNETIEKINEEKEILKKVKFLKVPFKFSQIYFVKANILPFTYYPGCAFANSTHYASTNSTHMEVLVLVLGQFG